MTEKASRIMVLSMATSTLLQYIILLALPWLCTCRSFIFINEVNVRVEGSSGVSQFIEIACFNTPPDCQITYNTYKLVFFDSQSIYKIITLPEKSMSADELLLIGPSEVDPWVDWGEFSIHLDSPSAVTLFYDPGNVITIGTTATWSGVISIFYFSMDSPANALPSAYSSFFPKDDYFHYLTPEPDKSINYCRNFRPSKSLARPTPGAPNVCPSGGNTPDVLINEVNAASPQGDRYEFLEFINIASLPVHLGNYTIVLYDGRTNVAYMVIHLVNATLPPGEVYVVGSYRLNPHPDQIFQEGTFRALQNGADGVALYKHSNQSQYYTGMDLTDEGLEDALVYDVRGRHSEVLTAVLTPGQGTLHEDWRAMRVDESLSRCYGTDARNSSQFANARRSPGESNICTARRRPGLPSHTPSDSLSAMIINEFSLEVSNQYIELYDRGIGNYNLDGLLVVLYNSRSMRAYTDPVSLNGFVTDQNGYFLIKVGDVASDAEASITTLSTIDINAIALYKVHSNNIVRGSLVTSENLVDVVFYGTPAVSRQRDLTDVLLPGSTPLDMDQILLASNSYSRCKGWAPKQISSFILTSQTPNARNSCPLPQLVINEVDLPEVAEEKFVELLSSDQGNLPLDGIVFVVYERGHSSPSYYLSLDNYATNEAGLFTIGHENGTNVDIAVDDPGWTMNIGSVAVYLGSVTQFDYTSSILQEGLVDGLVVSTDAGIPDLDLMNIITPHQNQLNDLDDSTSISRCTCCDQQDATSFGTGPPSPGAINSECRSADGSMVTESLKFHQALLRINEVYTTPGGNGLFIELYDKGYSGVKMDDLMLSLYSSQHQFYSHYLLRKDGPLGVTDANGFYFIGTTMAGVSMNMEVHGSERLIRGTTNVIVLWESTLDPSQLTQTTPINKDDIIDAVAFSDRSLFDFRTSEMFTTNQPNITLNSTFMTGAFSISRCHSRDAADQLAFTSTMPTPGTVNNCPMPSIVINEFNVMVFGYDLGEFIEISSLGVPNYPISNVVLVMYNPKGLVYRKYDLNGRRTDSNGLFVLGYERTKFPAPDMPVFAFSGNYIKNGPDAIALHRGKMSDFRHRSAGTNKNLIDAVVYGVNQDEVAQNLIDIFTPGRPQAFEITSESTVDESINRCVEGGVVVYRSAHVSPKFPNFCPNNIVTLLINEISLDPDNQFIEIWDVGISLSSLDDTSIVLFDREGRSYMEIPLTDYRTDSGGYFVVGTSSVSPRSHYANSFASGFIRTTSGAVTLYRSMSSYNAEDGSILTGGLLDAMIYVDPREQLAGTLLESLTPGSSPLPSLLLQEEGSSISRCFSDQLMTNNVFSVRPITPTGLNDCPVFETDVVINEINVDELEDSENSGDFIELYDGGEGNSSLDGLTLVLFNAGHEDRSYLAIGLGGYRTNMDGYFVIGASTSMDNPDISLAATGFLHNGPDGVAVYRAPSMAFTYGTVAVPQSVIDGIVYSLTGNAAVSMATKLTPGYPTFHQSSDFATSSISRCYGNARRNPTKFGLASPSPGRPNNCSSASDQFQGIIINEVNIEQGNSKNAEFIEIYSLGAGDVSLDDLVLIFFDGANQGRSYFEVDLNGGRTNNDGFYTVGRSNPLYVPDKTINHNFIQDGPDAVVLYRRPLSDFPRGTVATLDGAMDVLVYGSNGQGPSVLVDILASGQIQVNEQSYVSKQGSLSRCLSNDSMTISAFITSYFTPGSRNNCTLSPIYINEVNFDISKDDKEDFIELYDGGKGFIALDALVLVFFSEMSGTAFRTLSLQNNLTDINGYFTIGGANVMTDLAVDSTPLWGMLARYPGAVALYRGSSTDYQIGMRPTTTNLVDAVVLGSVDNPASSLAAVLSPDQSQILEEKFFLQGDESISRCRCCIPLKTSEFGLGLATPKKPNTCSVLGEIYPKQAAEEDKSQSIIINEVKLTKSQDGLLPMELEILWSPRRNLDNYVIIYYSADRFGSTSYLIMALSGETTDENGFYSLTEDKAAKLEYLQYSRGRDWVQAVAIYDRTLGKYSYGMTVTDEGLLDAVTFSQDDDDTVKSLQSVLTPTTPALVMSDGAKNFLASYQPLSLSRCDLRSIRNNSAFIVTSWTPSKPNRCPTTDFTTLVQLRLTNAIYTQWISNSAWKMLFKDVIVKGVERYCQCGFSLPYFTNESMFESEGSVVYEAKLLGLEKRQMDLISMSVGKFVKLNSTITIMDQQFLLDDCIQCLMNPQGQRKGKAGTVLLSLVGVVVLGALIAVIVLMAHRYRGDLHMLYIKTLKAKGSPDGIKFNNNQGGVDVGIDEGIANPVYQGASQDSNPPPPKFQDPAVNTSGEVPCIVTC